MKVLMLGWELPPNNSGGLGVACFNLARALAKTGAEIDFVLPYDALHPEVDFMNILPALSLEPLLRYGFSSYDSNLGPSKKLAAQARGLNIREIQKQYCEYVDKYLKTHHPDVVHAHDWLTFEAGILAKEKYGIPLIAHVHATEYDRSGGNVGNQEVIAIEKAGLLAADEIFAVSQATKNLIVDKYQISPERVEVLYNSLDDDFVETKYEYDDDDYKYLEMMKREGYIIVATVGRFTAQKGLINLLKAAARAISKNPKLLFVFAGDGEQKPELLKLTAEYGISRNVIFTGFLRDNRLRDIYQVADIFVMSSISEPFGLTALEAAHYGNVLILTKQSGVSEIIRSVMSYDFWDIEKLADEIVAVSSSVALRNTLRKGILAEYHKTSWADVAKKVEKIYNNVDNHKENY